MRRAFLLVAVILAASFVPAAVAKDKTPAGNPDTPGIVTGTAPSSISPDQAGIVGSGAVVEGTAPAPMKGVSETEGGGGSVACWNADTTGHWGVWPQNQSVTAHTNWCGNSSGILTYRSTWVTTDSFFCGASDSYAHKTQGGAGTGGVVVEAGAYFACPTSIPWLETHWHRWIQVYYGGDGSAWTYDWS